MPGLTDPDDASTGATGRAGDPAAPDDPPPTPPPTSTPVETLGPAAEPSVPASAIPPTAETRLPDPTAGGEPSAPSPPVPAPPAASPAGEEAPTPLRERIRIPVTPHVVVLTAMVTLTFVAFVLIEPTPRWLLIFGAIVAVIGTDGTLRATWRVAFSGPAPVDSKPFLLLPALYVLATPILIEHNARGYAVIPAALAGGIAFSLIVIGEVLSVHERAREYPFARWVVAAGAYFTAFALFAMPYVFELSLRASIGAVALVSVMLAVELLREGQVDPLETIVFAFVSALVMAELRWALHYLPIDGYLAGLALVLAFFLVTGVIGSYLTRRLDAILAVEYAIVAALGIALVIFARASGAV